MRIYQLYRDILDIKALVAWIKRGCKRRPRWEPRTQWIKDVLRRRDGEE